ncbi:unnamed protein product [Closterium sp. Naga37s-1]|nr:unnamed protein product [Closterium sp. Naga37s-1]
MEEGRRGRKEEEGNGAKIGRGLERRNDLEAEKERKRKGKVAEEEEGEEGAAEQEGGLREVAEEALREWEEVRDGLRRLMGKYPVMVCGYCPEVHVICCMLKCFFACSSSRLHAQVLLCMLK